MRKKLALLGIMFLAGCGGGDGSFTLKFSQSPLVATMNPDDVLHGLNVDGTIEGTPPSGDVAVLVSDSSNTFQQGAANISVDDRDFSANLPISSTARLIFGPHSGTLTITVCRYSGGLCKTTLAQATLPYTVTFTAPTLGISNPVTAIALKEKRVRVPVTLAKPGNINPVWIKLEDSSNVFDGSKPVSIDYSDEYKNTRQVDLPLLSSTDATHHLGTITLRICGTSDCASPGPAVVVNYDVQIMQLLAGQPEIRGQIDGPGAVATFQFGGGVWNKILDRMIRDGEGNVFRAEGKAGGGSNIRKITPDGVVSTPISFDNSRGYISDIAYNSTGDLFAVRGERIIKIASQNDVTEFYDARGSTFVFDSNDNLYTTYGSFLFKYTSTGEKTPFSPTTNFYRPFGITTDSINNIYVSDMEKVYKIAPDGTAITIGAGIPEPKYLAFDHAGNLFVRGLKGIYRIAANGTVTFPFPDGLEPLAIYNPLMLNSFVIAPDNTMYFFDSNNTILLKTALP